MMDKRLIPIWLAGAVLAVAFTTAAKPNFAIFQARGSASVYEGLTATRTGVNSNSLDTTNKQMMTRTTHIARDDISNLKIISSNFYVSGALVEAGSGAATTVTASIEYPNGTCTQVKFSTLASGSIPDGSTLTSDSTTVSIPAGATFYVRQYQTNTAATIYTGLQTLATDNLRLGVSGIVDQTISCGAISNTGGGMQLPLAIVSMTKKPSVCIFGDSIAYGTADTSSGDVGLIEPSIGPAFGYSNVAVPSDRAVFFIASNTQRRKIIPYCSHAIVEYGTNDFAASRSLVQLKTDLSSIYALLTTQTIFQTTILPRPSTTDGCSTIGNQTVPSFEASRTSLNDQLRTLTFGPNAGTFDTSNTVESGSNSGKWKVTPSLWSDDCVHPNTFGYGQVTSSAVINTTRIFR